MSFGTDHLTRRNLLISGSLIAVIPMAGCMGNLDIRDVTGDLVEPGLFRVRVRLVNTSSDSTEATVQAGIDVNGDSQTQSETVTVPADRMTRVTFEFEIDADVQADDVEYWAEIE